MKKLLTVSVLAIMAVSAANADIASTTYVNSQTGAGENGDITYTGKNYINGATNLKVATESLDAAIKGVADTVSGLDNSGIADKIETALSDGNYVQEGDSLAVFDNTDTGFVNAGGAVTAVEQAGYAKTADVVTNTELAELTATKAATAGQVVTGVTTTGGVVTAVSESKITNDFIDDGTISQAKITGLMGALEGKADDATTLAGYGITDAYTKTETDGLLVDKVNTTDLASKTAAGIVKMSTEAADAKSGSTDVTLSGSAIRAAIDDSISDLSTEVSGKQPLLTPGDYVNIDENNVITTTYIGTDTVAITKNADGKGELSVQNGSIGADQLDSDVNADIAKGVAAHTAVTVPTITEGNPDGMYALTAKVVGGVVSGYSWEAIGR